MQVEEIQVLVLIQGVFQILPVAKLILPATLLGVQCFLADVLPAAVLQIAFCNAGYVEQIFTRDEEKREHNLPWNLLVRPKFYLYKLKRLRWSW